MSEDFSKMTLAILDIIQKMDLDDDGKVSLVLNVLGILMKESCEQRKMSLDEAENICMDLVRDWFENAKKVKSTNISDIIH